MDDMFNHWLIDWPSNIEELHVLKFVSLLWLETGYVKVKKKERWKNNHGKWMNEVKEMQINEHTDERIDRLIN